MNPKELIETREEILKKMIDYFMNAECILGIFLSGSLAQGNWDEFSDIDFRVIVDDKYIDYYINNRLTIPNNWGDLIYNEYSLSWKNMCVSHFKPFIKVDVFYYKSDEINPSLWHNKGIKIIYDKTGKIAEIVEESKKLAIEYNKQEINMSIDKTFALIHEVYRRAKRNEVIYANDLLNGLRMKVIEFDDIINNRLQEGSSHYENRGNKDIILTLHNSYSTNNQKNILETLYSLSNLLEKQIKNLVTKFEIERDIDKDNYSFRVVKNNYTRSTHENIHCTNKTNKRKY